ncbi:hypothetical protein E2C01_006180 [Portunus trituberculatus]|uniref:Uncharacterized protein n=1 Tax=Portunus trituberculatus TaxID=210409 RepID=A0A5B7CYL2_PORTR|nr:hypothetical protein [Portunus trituberculatus]
MLKSDKRCPDLVALAEVAAASILLMSYCRSSTFSSSESDWSYPANSNTLNTRLSSRVWDESQEWWGGRYNGQAGGDSSKGEWKG